MVGHRDLKATMPQYCRCVVDQLVVLEAFFCALHKEMPGKAT
jgi:hypothetical protein